MEPAAAETLDDIRRRFGPIEDHLATLAASTELPALAIAVARSGSTNPGLRYAPFSSARPMAKSWTKPSRACSFAGSTFWAEPVTPKPARACYASCVDLETRSTRTWATRSPRRWQGSSPESSMAQGFANKTVEGNIGDACEQRPRIKRRAGKATPADMLPFLAKAKREAPPIGDEAYGYCRTEPLTASPACDTSSRLPRDLRQWGFRAAIAPSAAPCRHG